MAINSCTINAFTINSLRCRRPDLFRPLPPVDTVAGTNNGHIRDTFAIQHPDLVRHIENEPVLQFEQPFVTVTAELMGETGSQTLEAKQQLEFAVVTDLTIGEGRNEDVAVNISDFTITPC